MDANANFSRAWFGGRHFADLKNLSGWSNLLVPCDPHVLPPSLPIDQLLFPKECKRLLDEFVNQLRARYDPE
jgi:hypothetical protein